MKNSFLMKGVEKKQNESTGPPMDNGKSNDIFGGTIYSDGDKHWEDDAIYWWKPKGFNWIHQFLGELSRETADDTWEGWYKPPSWRAVKTE
ncbi:MAG: hypothetical protein JXR95_11490 [Deltaproteobacteria bacterium]|nr:hypothetical protein [Deltaproteobacteria bacterium]